MIRVFDELRRRLGWLPRRKGKAIVVRALTPAVAARCRSVADELAGRFPRVRTQWICRGRPDGVDAGDVTPPPLNRRLLLARAKARLVVADTAADPSARALLACARGEGIDVVDLADAPVDVDALAVRLKAALERPHPGAGRLRGVHGVACRVAAALGPSVRTIDALRSALDAPRTILCLGNGPSSEDRRLDDVDHDALFRVNHMWQSRGRLTAADVVFTGLRSAVRALRGGPIFIAQGRDDERRLALMRFVTPRRVRTASAEALDLIPSETVPTNGAVMLAAAVALAPSRIVIAGMDLFRHPEGAYPGDATTANAYTPLHDADVELAFILSVLERFDGELVILSDALAHEWETHVDRRKLAVRGA